MTIELTFENFVWQRAASVRAAGRSSARPLAAVRARALCRRVCRNSLMLLSLPTGGTFQKSACCWIGCVTIDLTVENLCVVVGVCVCVCVCVSMFVVAFLAS